jgi:Zn-dependent peptidase ImmA (M78 family)/DNA-binding XRE family transcriptional regulator
MDPSALSANLRRLRTARKLSQSELAERAGLSREGYRRIEEGLVEARVDSLMRIAAILEIRVEELLVPVRQLKAVRFRALKRMTSREDLLASVARWLDNYCELEELLGSHVAFKLNELASKPRRSRGKADPKALAVEARRKLGLMPDAMIRDLCGLLEHAGVKIFTPEVASEGFFGLSVGDADGGPAIVVNCWERISVERWIFTAVHELGHLLLHLNAYDVAMAEEEPEQENEANLFASHFLMPDELFKKEWEEARGLELVQRVFKIKRIFRVSWKTVVYRIAEQSSDAGKVWAQFYSSYKRSTGKSLRAIEEPDGLTPDAFLAPANAAPVARVADEPERLLPSDFVEDRLLGLVRTAVDQDAISLGRAAEILDTDLKSMRRLAASWMV